MRWYNKAMNKKLNLFWVFLLLTAGLFSQNRNIVEKNIDVEEEAFSEIDGSFALVIGESNYMHWSPLSGVAKDVPAVKQLLEEQGFQVEVGMDLGRDLMPRVKQFFHDKGYIENTRLIFYFAGHGIQYDNDGYIVPIDTPNPRIKEIEFYQKAIRLQEFVTLVEGLKSRHILMMFDSCFSGALFKYRGEEARSENIRYSTSQPVRHFITSGTENEKVPDDSFFREYFVEALKKRAADSNNDGYVTGTELGEFLKERVSNSSSGRQHPQSAKLNNPKWDKGDFVFSFGGNEQNENVPRAGLDSYNQGLAFLNRGEYEKAIAEFTRSIRSNMINSALAYKHRGNSYFSQGEYEKAVADYGQTLLIYPDETSVYVNRGAAYYQLNDMRNALDDLSKAIALNPNLPESYNFRGNVYYSMGNYNQAIADFNRALEINPQYVSALNNRGAVYRSKGDFALAVADFSSAHELSSGTDGAYYNRGIVSLEINDLEREIDEYTRIIGSDSRGVVHYSRGRAYQTKGELSKALDDYNRALAMNPQFLDALHARAQVYADMGELDRAIADYSQVIAAAPSFWEAYFSRADAYIAMSNIGEAANDYNRGFDYLENEENQTYINYTWNLVQLFYTEFPFFTSDTFENNPGGLQFALLVMDCVSESIRRMELSSRAVSFSDRNLMEMCFYYAGVDLEANFGSPENAFLYSEALRNRGLLKQRGTDTALRLSGVTANERNRSLELNARLRSLQTMLDNFGTRNLNDREKVEYREVISQYNAAEQELLALHETIGNRIPQFRELSNPRQMSVEDAVSFCGDNRAFLEYMLWDPSNTVDGLGINSYCIVLSKDGVNIARLDHTFDYQGAVEDIYKLFDDGGRFRPINTGEPQRNNLYNQLIKPILSFIPATIKNISIVPDGSLVSLPFDILRETSETTDFGESFRISFSLSVAVSALAADGGQATLEPILAFGGTVYEPEPLETRPVDLNGSVRGLVADLSEDEGTDGSEGTGPGNKLVNRRWPYLPGTKTEVENIAALGYDTTVITGVNASESRLKELSRTGELQKYRVLHFAITNYFDNYDPSSSALIFSEAGGSFPELTEDGYLTPAEIAQLNINADIAILSTCQSGLGGMDGMTGFEYSFMIAGAARVISAIGKIDDRTTVDFMDSLYKKVYQEGMNFRDALYEVKNGFRQGKYGQRYTRPYFWAGFTLYE